MMIATILTAVAAAATTPPAVVAARPTYDAERDRYCVRLSRGDVTLPSGARVYRRACRTLEAWQRDGVTLERRARS